MIIILVLLLSASFGSSQLSSAQDAYYASIDKKNGPLLTAAPKREKDQKSPLRKRAHKRKRKIRYPARGK